MEETKECPICLEVKDVNTGFGLRSKPEGPRPNSWCRKCRATGKIKSQIEREQREPKHWGDIVMDNVDAMAKAFSPTPEQTERLKKFCKPVALPTVDDFYMRAQLKQLAKAEQDAERDSLRAEYFVRFPNDKAGGKRSINFMKQRLGKNE